MRWVRGGQGTYDGAIAAPEERNDHATAAALASQAGEHLLAMQHQLVVGGESGGWWPEERADAAGHELLMELLAQTRPQDGVLSEEGEDDLARLERERVWIVDPLDGSSGYGWGNAEWAIHVALTVRGAGHAAAVALPVSGLVFSTAVTPTVPDRHNDRPVVVTGRSRARIDGTRVARALGADLVACGSAGVKAMLVVTGQADVYVHAGPLWEWDVCAPAIVAEAAGLHVSDAAGQPLTFNKPRAVNPGFVVARPDLAEATLASLR